VTDNAPDDTTKDAEDAATETSTEKPATADTTAKAVDAADEATTEIPEAEKPTVTVAKKAKPAPSPVVDDDEAEDEAETAPVVRRPRPTPKAPRPAAAVAGSGNTVTTVVITVAVIALMAATAIFGFLYFNTRGELNDMKAADADRAKAEKVAIDYAVGAASFDYRDLGPWSGRLTTGVSPELKSKMEATVGAMNQLLQPLQWVSKGTGLDSVVNSQSGPVYKVTAYVNVDATNAQSTAGRSVVTVYNVTLNKDADWQITDVGGLAQPGGLVPSDSGAAPAPTSTVPAPAPAPGN
jgi:hypothetical protein